ncbi:unnamed protein product, partial [Mycena citricolor]
VCSVSIEIPAKSLRPLPRVSNMIAFLHRVRAPGGDECAVSNRELILVSLQIRRNRGKNLISGNLSCAWCKICSGGPTSS